MSELNSQELLLSYIKVKNFYKDLLKQEKTPIAKFEILMILNTEKNIRVGELSEKIKITRPNLTPLVEELSQKGFISKKQDEKDKRATILNITKKGIAEYEKNMKVIDERLVSVNSSLSEEQIEILKSHTLEILEIIAILG